MGAISKYTWWTKIMEPSLDKSMLAAMLRRSIKATLWPKEAPDSAIGAMVSNNKKRNGKKKAERRK